MLISLIIVSVILVAAIIVIAKLRTKKEQLKITIQSIKITAQIGRDATDKRQEDATMKQAYDCFINIERLANL